VNCARCQVHTHVISSIIHIDHEYFDDDEAWPIEIEDHDGELHSLLLEPGQVSGYKCVYVFCVCMARREFCGKETSVPGVRRCDSACASCSTFFGPPLHCVVYC
jgi:hypothetical protein